MRSKLFGQNVEADSTDGFVLQNPRMLKVALSGDVMARQGSMVAYQGEMDFAFSGGGVGRLVKRALTGEGVPLMKVSGQGDLFLANDADEVHLVYLEDETFTVNGQSLLAFESHLKWDIERLKGVSMFGGMGMFNTTISGTGWVAVLAHGTPVILKTNQPTFVDAQALVGWSTQLSVGVKSSVKLGNLVGRGSGESFQLSFSGQGFVIVQASEGVTVAPHAH